MSLLLAVLILGLIILFHEFGHFLLAKLCGIGVLEFSLGMGPRLVSVQRGETRYSIKALPFGGSCMMLGEDEEDKDPRAFNNKPVLSRILVVAAGPVFNFLLAFGLALILVGATGRATARVMEVQEGYPGGVNPAGGCDYAGKWAERPLLPGFQLLPPHPSGQRAQRCLEAPGGGREDTDHEGGPCACIFPGIRPVPGGCDI